MNPLFAALLPLLQKLMGGVIGKYLPDPAQQAQAQQEMIKLLQSEEFEHLHAETQLALAQADITKAEAQNPSTFVAGGRPAIIWTCALTLFCYYVPYSIAATVLWVIQCVHTGTLTPHPDIGISDMIALVTSTLGLSTLRSYDKTKGIDTKQIGN